MANSLLICRIPTVDNDNTEDHIPWLKTQLEEQGFVVQFATSGWTALDIVKVWRPDIALLDIILRDMLGYSVTSRIRQNSDFAQTRIILFTASSVLEESEAIAAGANAFLCKPIDFDQLPLVKNWCAHSNDRL